MIKKGILLFTAVVLLGAAVFFLVKYTTPQIAYVRSGELVNKYEGMKEARTLYKDKMSKWQSNIDTLEADYQRAVSQYNVDLSKLSGAAKTERERSLEKQRQNIQQYAKTLDEKAQEEDNKMTTGVINQINSFIEEYGKKEGYDFILGTTQEGNLLYGSKAKDITEEVLEELNKTYKTPKN